MIHLISPEKKQYKANLHCHSILSDGNRTPEELKKMYRGKGYSVLAITDHERPCKHTELSEEDFLLLTGYEAYLRPEAKFSSYREEIHLNLFAKDPDNVKMIAFDERFCRYLIRDNMLSALEYVGEPHEREFTQDYVNYFIKTATENGYLVSYNHPWWNMQTEETILSYDGYFSMEMYNYSSDLMNGVEYNAYLYDKMLRQGKRVFCHATDDNHNKFPEDHPNSDSFGGFTMILADSLTYGGVIDAMEKGEMYASSGPEIFRVSVEENKVFIECSEARSIHANFGGKKTAWLQAEKGKTVCRAEFEIPDGVRYLRVSVVDREGKRADTRGYFRDEIGFPPLETK